jgi:hypothetical protein
MILETALILSYDLESKIKADSKAYIQQKALESPYSDPKPQEIDAETIELFEKLFKTIDATPRPFQ